MKPRLPGALAAWGTPRFEAELKRELEACPAALPLQQGTTQGGVADGHGLAVSVFAVREEAGALDAELGVFFTEVVAGCNCGDDPMALHAYCVMRLRLDKTTGDAAFSIAD